MPPTNISTTYISHLLGKGNQGIVCAVSKELRIFFVIKIVTSPDFLLFEANAMYAKRYHPITLLPKHRFLGLATPNRPVKEYCMMSDYVNGSQLQPRNDLLPRECCFTKYCKCTCGYTRNKYYGLSIKLYYFSETDYISEIYNNYLRLENHIAEENKISKNRIYNVWQNADFCELIILIGYIIASIKSEEKIPFFHLIPAGLEPLTPLFELLLKGNKHKQTYQHWIDVVDMLSPDF
ncbi:hypothetical protein SNEBB_001134 [Seison nebaliae]|nr:hypothetical protein SNEBB_001134 [Seison nebaliae]